MLFLYIMSLVGIAAIVMVKTSQYCGKEALRDKNQKIMLDAVNEDFKQLLDPEYAAALKEVELFLETGEMKELRRKSFTEALREESLTALDKQDLDALAEAKNMARVALNSTIKAAVKGQFFTEWKAYANHNDYCYQTQAWKKQRDLAEAAVVLLKAQEPEISIKLTAYSKVVGENKKRHFEYVAIRFDWRPEDLGHRRLSIAERLSESPKLLQEKL